MLTAKASHLHLVTPIVAVPRKTDMSLSTFKVKFRNFATLVCVSFPSEADLSIPYVQIHTKRIA